MRALTVALLLALSLVGATTDLLFRGVAAATGLPSVQTVIVASQPTNGLGNVDVLEKTIDYFTNTTNPSIVVGYGDLGNNGGLYIYTNIGSIAGTWTRAANIGGRNITDCYERTRSIKFAGDVFPNIVASCNNTTSIFINPANSGGNPLGKWSRTIVQSRGAHDIRAVDIDGDGKLDIVASSSAILGVGPNFIAYQNSPTSWQVVDGPIPPNGSTLQDDIDVLPGVAGNGNNIVGTSDGGGIYWFAYPGSRTGTWTSHLLTSNAGRGSSLSAGVLGGLGYVAVANNEIYDDYSHLGLRYFTQPANPNNPWNGTTIDSTFTAVHEITTGIWQGTPYLIAAEEEQACIDIGGDPSFHAGIPCRVTFFQFTNGSWNATQLDPQGRGTQNQSVIQQGQNLLVAGANHEVYGGYAPLQLWIVH
jgi:hypothetical protein